MQRELQTLYRNWPKSWNLPRRLRKLFCLEQASIVRVQGARKDEKFAAKPTRGNSNFLAVFGIFTTLSLLHAEPVQLPVLNKCRETRADELIGNLPFISDINFINISDVVLDACTEWFDPNLVELGDIIFVSDTYLDWFVKIAHPRINTPYILVTSDHGRLLPLPSTHLLLYDSKCASWFGINMMFSYHPKLRQLPIGQAQSKIGKSINHHFINETKQLFEKKPYSKSYLLYMNHFPRSYGDRNKIISLFENVPFCHSRNHSNESYACRGDFLEELSASTFVISPIGLEIDCFRHWEALTLDCIPILEHSFLDPLFDDAPVSFVHQWEEIDEAFLKKEYERLKDVKTEKYLFEPWAQEIKETQKKVRNGDLAFTQCKAMQWNAEEMDTLTNILTSLCSRSKARTQILIKGYLSSIHALQIAQAFPDLNQIYLHDFMINDYIWNNLAFFLVEPYWHIIKKKIKPIFSESALNKMLHTQETICFLDLSYFRHGLHSLENRDKIRHSLKNDLQALYNNLYRRSTLCGNMIQNRYVKEVLEFFAQDNALVVENKGNFWWLKPALKR